ncbi:MAG: hypothetical protein ACON38_16745 [Akkermansiaceae bacterium]
MSDENPQTPDDNGALDLSGLNFGPAWARDPSESKSLKKFKDRGDRGDRGDSRGRGRGDRNDRRGGGGGGGFRGDKRGGGGDRRGGFKGKGGGRRGDHDGRPQRQEVEPPAGFKLQLMPAEESLDLLAKQVIETGRTYSVFDLAKVLLQSRDRFRVIYDSSDQKFFRCREDQSIWLTRDEALRHIWKAGWLSKFYDEVKVEGEAPKGSFSSVSRCGISGELLGPPNYHGFQEKLMALHRERFSNMSLDAYKAKVRTEHGEEAVEAWLESMKMVTKWKVKSGEEEAVEEKAPDAKEEPAQEEAPADSEETPVVEETVEETPEAKADEEVQGASEEVPVAEESSESPAEASSAEASSAEAPAEGAPVEEEPPVAEDDQGELLDDARALERHFAENHFDQVFEETGRAWVMGDIKGNLLSPGLLTMLKRGVAEEKRYPANLMPLVCRQLSGRHVAVFKWDKKLKVGPSRPHAVSTETPLAARPQAMIDYLQKNSGAVLKDFWAAVRPADLDDASKHEWLQDFQWLLSQGHIILLCDTTVHLAKKGPAQEPAKKAAKKEEPKSFEAAPKEAAVDSGDEPKAGEKAAPAEPEAKNEEESKPDASESAPVAQPEGSAAPESEAPQEEKSE